MSKQVRPAADMTPCRAEHCWRVPDMHTALADPGLAGADGKNWGASPAQQAERSVVQWYIDTVAGPSATKL